MTDKKIINGVDVSGCEYLNNEWCYQIDASNCEGSLEDAITPCEENPNCFYKQLQRKEQECEHLRTQLNSYHIGEPQLVKENQTLKSENEELKKKADCYNCGPCNGKEDYTNMQRHCENAINSLHKEQKQSDRYKQALEKIKKILEEPDLSIDELGKLTAEEFSAHKTNFIAKKLIKIQRVVNGDSECEQKRK